MKKILIIDDDVNIGNMLEEYLENQGYITNRAYSGTEALLILDNLSPDLILLDLMLPGLTGEEILPKIKGIPVIVVSAKANLDNKVNLLLDGAVDYITKPFSMRELAARIHIHIKNYETLDDSSEIVFRDLKVDVRNQIIKNNKKELKLTRAECIILKSLMHNSSQVVTKSILLDELNYDLPDCTENSLKMHMSNLRKKIRILTNAEYIESIWGIGFKMKKE